MTLDELQKRVERLEERVKAMEDELEAARGAPLYCQADGCDNMIIGGRRRKFCSAKCGDRQLKRDKRALAMSAGEEGRDG